MKSLQIIFTGKQNWFSYKYREQTIAQMGEDNLRLYVYVRVHV